MKILEFYDRALSGKRVTEQEFDMKLLPAKLRQLVKKYEITYNPEEPVPQDLDMAKRTFEAAIELLVEVGIHCKDTQSIITIGEEERVLLPDYRGQAKTDYSRRSGWSPSLRRELHGYPDQLCL